jgi:hypothetical protein
MVQRASQHPFVNQGRDRGDYITITIISKARSFPRGIYEIRMSNIYIK